MLSCCTCSNGELLFVLLCLLLQESKAASELADKVLGDVQRSSNDMAQLNSWLQVRVRTDLSICTDLYGIMWLPASDKVDNRGSWKYVCQYSQQCTVAGSANLVLRCCTCAWGYCSTRSFNCS
jgi:hypothetical protein